MKMEIRYCEICKKEIKVYQERIGSNHFNKKQKIALRQIVSDEGVLFKIGKKLGRWFCLDCWEKVRK